MSTVLVICCYIFPKPDGHTGRQTGRQKVASEPLDRTPAFALGLESCTYPAIWDWNYELESLKTHKSKPFDSGFLHVISVLCLQLLLLPIFNLLTLSMQRPGAKETDCECQERTVVFGTLEGKISLPGENSGIRTLVFTG